jgi:hypothetical protein
MKRTYIILVILLPIIYSYITIYGGQKQRLNLSVNIVEHDSLFILSKMSLSKQDSIFLHIGKRNDSLFIEHDDILTIDKLSKNNIPLYLRSIISYYPAIGEHFELGAFLFLYSFNDSIYPTYKVMKDSIELILGGLYSYEPNIQIVDINYDGYKDIIISFITNTTGRNSENFFFVYNLKRKEYISDEILNNLFQDQSIYIDVDKKEISVGDRIGAIGFEGEAYRWDGIKYQIYARINTDYNDEAKCIISTREELINGKWTVVKCDSIDNK